MTISTTKSRFEFTGDGSTTVFPYTNKIFADAELDVFSDNVLQTLTTDYTVSGAGVETGGAVTYVTAPASGVAVVIIRVVADTQATDYPAGGALPSGVIEDDIDRRTIVSQQQEEKFSRAMLTPAGEVRVDMTLPTIADRASNFLGFDADGKSIAAAGSVDGVPTTPFTKTLLDDVDATAARTTLAAAGNPLTKALDPNGQFIGRDKGSDIASASPLVIGTDGDYFDVTGTTGFSAMTVATNRSFVLQFDDAVTITVGSGITLNNAGSNYTTAAGDIIVCQSTAANTVTGWIIKADGTAVVVNTASTTVAGKIEIATDAEADTGTDTSRALVPSMFGVDPARQSLGNNGYQRFPGGLIIQWGNTSLTGNQLNKVVALPLTFPNNFFAVISGTANSITAAQGTGQLTAVKTGLTSITFDNSIDISMTSNWVAFGN